MPWNIRADIERGRQIESRARDFVESFVGKRLPGEVRQVNVALGADHDGDPALFIDLFVLDDEHATAGKVEQFSNAISELQSIISLESDGYFPYIKLRKSA
jgi:hypothetical protein